MLGPSAYEDRFARDHLPDPQDWPVFKQDGPFNYPQTINVGHELSDKMVEQGFGNRTALIGHGRRRTYKELADWSNRIAHALVSDYGLKPGNRVLIRSGNNPAMVAAWLGLMKAGGIAVNTMPMLRAVELAKIVDKAQITLALCDMRLATELDLVKDGSPYLNQIVYFDGTSSHQAELDEKALEKPVEFDCIPTSRDDIALIAFTSGTTGDPKGTMHCHRDLLAIADGYASSILQVSQEDVFVGSPPLAFTFGLGGLAIFPLRFGASAALLENATPPNLMRFIKSYGATIVFTAPTAYRVMLDQVHDKADFASLRLAVSAGETLPAALQERWEKEIGIPILNGIGTTEMLHIFLSTSPKSRPAGATGRPVPGYEVRLVDDHMKDVTQGTPGRLAVRGPTGCRYLDDPRQKDYVCEGWNITGDVFIQDTSGVFYFQARNDDMIISAGYNIAGPEVENALLSHKAVKECAVTGIEDENRGQIVCAHVVLAENMPQNEETKLMLQDHVKATIAPYKYPREIIFCEHIPKTQTGKIQRFKLKAPAI